MDVIEDIRNKKETLWINQYRQAVEPMSEMGGQKFVKVRAAQNRLIRFMPYIASAFPETAGVKGLIESKLIPADELNHLLGDDVKKSYPGNRIFIKDDAHLPVAGSVKARGGIHEVLAHAEKLMQHEHMLMPGDDYSEINSEEFKKFFGRYTIQVGSTGNLGLSIGIMGASLGFRVIVHMSADAREWKKELLRKYGVTVKEYEGDYSDAVAAGRKLSAEDPDSYFIDDENSEDLFFGYATAALRLKVQLYKEGIQVDNEHPLFVYIPCGVGGAPGGITFGIKQMFGNAAHCFFAEPVGAPCFTLGMSSGKKQNISIEDAGLHIETQADGLAVGRPSGFACSVMDPLMSGSFTVSDYHLMEYMRRVYREKGIFLEPSACAGVHGLTLAASNDEFVKYMEDTGHSENITHVVWATGGGLVPTEIMMEMLKGS